MVAERAQGLIELMLRTTQGLQHSDRRLNGRPGLPGTAPESHRQPRDDSVGHGERDEREPAAAYKPQFSSRAHPTSRGVGAGDAGRAATARLFPRSLSCGGQIPKTAVYGTRARIGPRAIMGPSPFLVLD